MTGKIEGKKRRGGKMKFRINLILGLDQNQQANRTDRRDRRKKRKSEKFLEVPFDGEILVV